MPDLSRLQLYHDSGSSHMGSMDYLVEDDVNDKARWEVKCERASLSSLRVHFAGGTGTADLTIRVDSHLGEAYDMTLHTIEDAGTGYDVNFRVPIEQAEHFYVCKGDFVVLTWTNLDPGNMKWGAELALKPCDRIANAG